MASQNGKAIGAKLRRYRVLSMKLAGATERQIAETEGVSNAQVNKDVHKVLEELGKENTTNADKVRIIQMERYNALLLRMWDGAMKGEPDAIDRVLKIMDRINQVNGVIPDKPLISMSIEQNNLQLNANPITFEIESAGDNSEDQIQKTESVSETRTGNILEG